MHDIVIDAHRSPQHYDNSVSYSWTCEFDESQHYPNLDLDYMITIAVDHMKEFHGLKDGFYQVFVKELVRLPDWEARMKLR